MKRTLLITLLCGLELAAFAASPPKPKSNGPKPARDGARFLFIVDTSASMKSIDSGTRQTVFDLIFSGIDGYMRTGDTFGVWTYNDQIVAGRYPMKVWDAEDAVDQASNATLFVREQEYAGDNRIEELMMKLSGVSRAATNVNVLLITDGDTKMQGTPVDREINSVYTQRNKERKAAKKPFITTLIVENGRIVNGFVTLAGEANYLPPRPAPAPAVVSPVTRAATNPVAPAPFVVATIPVQTAQAPSNPAAAQSASIATTAILESGLVKSESPDAGAVTTVASANVAAENSAAGGTPTTDTTVAPPLKKVMQIVTLPSRPAPKAEEPATAPATAQAKSEPQQVATTVAFAAPPPPASVPPQTPAVVSSEPFPPVTAAKPVEPARDFGLRAVVAPTPIVVAAREPAPSAAETSKSPAPAVLSAMQVPTPSGTGAIPTIIFGGILLAMALFLLGIALRRMRHEPQGSLITQSMHRR